MLKKYLFRVIKEQYVDVNAESKNEAFERAEEIALANYKDDEIYDVELEDIIEDDIDSLMDEEQIKEYEDECLIEDECDFY